MRSELGIPLNEFAVNGVSEFTLDYDRDGLVVFIAGHETYPLFL
jgi:hypothetical protein